jgi:hypothetical protein
MELGQDRIKSECLSLSLFVWRVFRMASHKFIPIHFQKSAKNKETSPICDLLADLLSNMAAPPPPPTVNVMDHVF